jgi:hypothetical protein
MKESRKNLVWLASYPKSGNTWVRIFLQQILGSAQDQKGFPNLTDIPIASNRSLLDNYLGVNSSDLTPQEINNYRPEIYRALSSSVSDLQILKVHDQFGITENGEYLFPPEVTRYAVYVIRNPLDVAVSYSYHSGRSFLETIQQMNDKGFSISSSENDLKAQINQYLGSWSEHVLSWTTQTLMPVYLIHYEHLLEQCEVVFRELIEILEISCNEKVFTQAINASNFSTLKEQEAMFGFKEKPMHLEAFFREGKKDNYKDHLIREQIRMIIDHHKSVMKRFGYNTSPV